MTCFKMVYICRERELKNCTEYYVDDRYLLITRYVWKMSIKLSYTSITEITYTWQTRKFRQVFCLVLFGMKIPKNGDYTYYIQLEEGVLSWKGVEEVLIWPFRRQMCKRAMMRVVFIYVCRCGCVWVRIPFRVKVDSAEKTLFGNLPLRGGMVNAAISW